MRKPLYSDVDGSTAKFLPLVNKYVEQQSKIIEDNDRFNKVLWEKLEQLSQHKNMTEYINGLEAIMELRPGVKI